MVKTDLPIPGVLEDCADKDAWEKKRKRILKTIAEIEYGKRPEMNYQLHWREKTRELVPELNAVHLITELEVETELGRYAFPVTAFLPVREEKVPAAVLICSQLKTARPMEMPEMLKGMKEEEAAETFARMFQALGVTMDLSALSMFPKPDENGKIVGTNVLDLDKDYGKGHWPVREMMKRGLAMAGFYANDVEFDDQQAYPSGLATIFGTGHARENDAWGILAVWAFAASCVREYLTSLSEVDGAHIAVTGHSRCGKAALWCGANDENFYAVMPNGSGCGGSALFRGKYGENLACITANCPSWFAPAFKKYAGKEGELPFDQHFLLAAVAPRVLHVGSGSEDAWADPEGEHYSTVLASAVWQLYDGTRPLSPQMPEPDGAETSGSVGYHVRKGPHLLDTFDWICFWEHIRQTMEK